jgi:hypothetical protein
MNLRAGQYADEVADYPSALSWLRSAWTTLPMPPAKLHTRDIDGQLGQRYSTPFARVLSGLGGKREVTVQDICYHPPLARQEPTKESPYSCRDCLDSGLHTVIRDLYDNPMYVALAGLAKVVRPSDGTPAPIDFVMALVWSGWDIDRAARLVRIPIVSPDHRITVKAHFLSAIRKLHSRYSTGPIGKSDSQRAAEDAA